VESASSESIYQQFKRDKIPWAKLIEDRKEEIVRYWDLVQATKGERFQKEIQVTLPASLLLPGRRRQFRNLSARMIT
jgi:hypothetical protein